MKWLPSRHHFALARLIALVMLKAAPRPADDAERAVFAVDRHQSSAENYAVAIVYTAITTCYIAALLPLPPPFALFAALPLAGITIQILIVGGGLLVRSMAANSALMMLCAIAASLYFATQPTWARFAAYAVLAHVALNAVAFVVMWLLRDRVRALELRCAA
jgi:hypothetical protein